MWKSCALEKKIVFLLGMFEPFTVGTFARCVKSKDRCRKMREFVWCRDKVWRQQLPLGIRGLIAGHFEADLRRCLHEDLEKYHAKRNSHYQVIAYSRIRSMAFGSHTPSFAS